MQAAVIPRLTVFPSRVFNVSLTVSRVNPYIKMLKVVAKSPVLSTDKALECDRYIIGKLIRIISMYWLC